MGDAKGKRVLMLLENNPYPHDYRVRREAKALAKAGYQVSVICPAGKVQPFRETIDGVHVYRYPMPPMRGGLLGYMLEYGYSLAAIWILSIYVFFQRGFDIIHAHNPPDILVLIAAGYKLLGKRFVFDYHDLSPEMYCAQNNGRGNRFIYRTLLFFEKLSFRLADHLIATNQSYKAVAETRGGVEPESITVVRNGPDLESIYYKIPPDPKLRKEAGTIIGYIGNMGFQDGVDYLIRALAHLKKDLGREDFYCVIIGKGAAVSGLKELTTSLEMDEHVWFTGFISDEDVMRYLSTVDICVDPDPSNPFNDRSTMIKMIEYMTYGKPIVAFDLPEHRVTAQEAALYARPNDELDFARKIAELIDAPDKRRQMGKLGRERIEKELAWDCQEPHIVTAYQKIAEQVQS